MIVTSQCLVSELLFQQLRGMMFRKQLHLWLLQISHKLHKALQIGKNVFFLEIRTVTNKKLTFEISTIIEGMFEIIKVIIEHYN